MDLIDASNAPAPVTHDPITGNPIVNNTGVDMDTSEDTSGSTAEPASDSSTHVTVPTRTVFPFENLTPFQQGGVIRLHSEITNAWDVVSPATPFPYQYHPDPDVRNWGHALMTGLSRLAQMSPKGLQRQAVQHVLDHLQERNEGLSALEGDHVLRPADIQYAIRQMGTGTTNSYRPPRQGPRGGPGGRPGPHGRGRRGQ